MRNTWKRDTSSCWDLVRIRWILREPWRKNLGVLQTYIAKSCDIAAMRLITCVQSHDDKWWYDCGWWCCWQSNHSLGLKPVRKRRTGSQECELDDKKTITNTTDLKVLVAMTIKTESQICELFLCLHFPEMYKITSQHPLITSTSTDHDNIHWSW